jgi:hypothetical protein
VLRGDELLGHGENWMRKDSLVGTKLNVSFRVGIGGTSCMHGETLNHCNILVRKYHGNWSLRHGIIGRILLQTVFVSGYKAYIHILQTSAAPTHLFITVFVFIHKSLLQCTFCLH